ncbi:hypothetical protein SALBM311S_12556 [Streptomyces alboniger]
MRVDGIRRVQPQCVPGLGRVERPEDQAVGPPVEGPVVRGEPLHHVQVTAEQQQEHGSAREQSVPGRLHRPVEHGVLLGEPGQLVEDHHAGRVGQDGGECAQGVGPVGRGALRYEFRVGREGGLSQFGHEVGDALPWGGALGRGEEDVRSPGPIAELLHQPRLPDLPPPPHRDGHPGTVGCDTVEALVEEGQLSLAAYERSGHEAS